LKLATVQGRARTVNVEVRRKRTYIKRDVLEEQARHQQEEIDVKRREALDADAAKRIGSRTSGASANASTWRTGAARKKSSTARSRRMKRAAWLRSVPRGG